MEADGVRFSRSKRSRFECPNVVNKMRLPISGVEIREVLLRAGGSQELFESLTHESDRARRRGGSSESRRWLRLLLILNLSLKTSTSWILIFKWGSPHLNRFKYFYMSRLSWMHLLVWCVTWPLGEDDVQWMIIMLQMTTYAYNASAAFLFVLSTTWMQVLFC